MEVHADINTNPQFKSNDALREAMGYILGMGFAFKAKPEAFASSSCANKAGKLSDVVNSFNLKFDAAFTQEN